MCLAGVSKRLKVFSPECERRSAIVQSTHTQTCKLCRIIYLARQFFLTDSSAAMCGRREDRLLDETPVCGPPPANKLRIDIFTLSRTNRFDNAHAFYRSVEKARVVFRGVSTYYYSDGITICQSRFTAITFLSSSLFSCTSFRSDGNLKRPFLTFGKDLLGVPHKACFSMEKSEL